MLQLEMTYYLPDHNLNYVDKGSMNHGIEVRVPFLDHELVQYASTIPDHFKVNSMNAKAILKDALSSLLPNEILNRPKTGFGVPIRSWLDTELRDYVDDCLSYHSVKNRGIFNPDKIQQLIQKNRDKSIDASYSILSLICIELWCKSFIDA